MTARAVGPGHRLFLRIYLVSVGVLVVLAFLVGLHFTFKVGDPREGLREPNLKYVTHVFATRWDSDQALRGEMSWMNELGHYRSAVYDLDGKLRAQTFPEAPAELSESVRSEVATSDAVRLSHACIPAFCPLAMAIEDHGRIVGYAVFAANVELPRAALLPPTLIFGGLLVAAILLAGTLTRPLQRLAVAARAFGEGDLSARTGLNRSDEIGQVARAFDEMASRLTSVLESQTVLLANVAHELRTPLARIRLALELAADGDLETARGSLAEIATDLDELERLVTDTLASARMDLLKGRVPSSMPSLTTERVGLGEIVHAACARARGEDRALVIECALGPDVTVLGDASLLRRVMENLLDNARKYSDRDQPITVRCHASPTEVEVAVVDRGVGISAQDLAQVGTPFFRADRSRGRKTGGIGLGLSLSKKIVEAHGGALTVESEPGVGTTVLVRLPRYEDDERRPPSREPASGSTLSGEG